MALPSKLFRFKIELSDLEKSSYQSLDLRIAQHPSESLIYLLTRVFAYSLSYEEGLEFSSGGLSDPDTPCIRSLKFGGNDNDIRLWVEVGSPNERKIHKASKASEKLKIFTYKDPLVLMNEINNHQIYHKENIEVYSISTIALENLSEKIKKDNRWTLIYMDSVMMINSDDFAEEIQVVRHQ